MRKRLLNHLVCPLAHTPLELITWESRPAPISREEAEKAEALGIPVENLSEEILTGVLVNRARKVAYPIHQGVPRMLIFSTGVASAFQKKHADRLRTELPGFGFPDQPSMPGEQDVLRSFSNEWVNYGWEGDSYWNLTPDTWFRCMRYILDLDQHPIGGRKLALEVGIGIGGVADHVSRSQGAEVVGVDLGYAVDAAYHHFGHNPFLHVVQASVFAPPFRDAGFDFVYSFGVIHHTFSTRAAFDRISLLPRANGRLFIWVYSPHDESRNLTRRVLMKVENAIRPWAWRLPDPLQTAVLTPLVPLYVGHQWLRGLRRGEGNIRYGLREALHAARDRFTPRYIHRHSDEEVMEWFRDAGYRQLQCSSRRDRPAYVPVAFTACTGVDGVRSTS